MQPAHVAFELAPRERAAYMKRELGPGQSEEDSTTLGGALPASLRSWLRQVCFYTSANTVVLYGLYGFQHIPSSTSYTCLRTGLSRASSFVS